MSRSRKYWIRGILILISLAGFLALLLYLGIVHINNPSKVKYPVAGVDVSAYQGRVD